MVTLQLYSDALQAAKTSHNGKYGTRLTALLGSNEVQLRNSILSRDVTKSGHSDPMSSLSTTSKDKDLIPSECTIDQIREALRWAREGGCFDHIREDVPEPAQRWVRDRIMQVAQRFDAWSRAAKVWTRLDGRTALSDLDPPLQDWLRERVMPVLGRLKTSYEGAKKTGRKTGWGEFSKAECQAAYDFIVSGRMPARMCELPTPLQWDLDGALGGPTRHLEKEADAAAQIALGMYAMSRTAKDVDAPCKEAVESRLPDLISALENRLRERGRSRSCER